MSLDFFVSKNKGKQNKKPTQLSYRNMSKNEIVRHSTPTLVIPSNVETFSDKADDRLIEKLENRKLSKFSNVSNIQTVKTNDITYLKCSSIPEREDSNIHENSRDTIKFESKLDENYCQLYIQSPLKSSKFSGNGISKSIKLGTILMRKLFKMKMFRYFKELSNYSNDSFKPLSLTGNSRSNRISYFKNSTDVSYIAPPSTVGQENGWFTPTADISQHRDIIMIQFLNILKKKLQTKSRLAYFKLKMNNYKGRKTEKLLLSLDKLIPASQTPSDISRSIDSNILTYNPRNSCKLYFGENSLRVNESTKGQKEQIDVFLNFNL